MLNPSLDTNRIVRIASMHDTGLSITPDSSHVGIAIHEPHTIVADKVLLFGFDIKRFPKHVQLIICALGAISFYMLSGIAQEFLFVHYEGFDYGFFFTLFQFTVYSIYSGIHIYIIHQREHMQRKQSPTVIEAQPNNNWFLWYCLLAALMVIGVGLGNQSLSYLNFPTKILFKSSKLLFAMIMGSFIIKRTYNMMDYSASLLLVGGLVLLFMANHNSTSIEWGLSLAEITGIIMLTCALMGDAITSNIQEKILKNDNRTATELIFYGHALGAIMLVFVCIVTNQFIPAIAFCWENPLLVPIMLGYSTLTYMGVQFVHTMTKLFGILVTLTVTSSRKVATVMLSFLIFPKPLTLSHLIAIILVFAGIFLRIYNKNREAIDTAVKRYFKK